MAARTHKTGAVVLPHDQWELLKRVASVRVLTGKASRSSASEVLRQIVSDAVPALEAEIADYEKRGPRS